MIARGRPVQDGGARLAIRTDIREKRRDRGNDGDDENEVAVTYRIRTASTHSIATSTDEQVNTMLSTSSAGNTSSLSSSELSANSTARTSTLSAGDEPDHEIANRASSQLRPTITVLDLVSTSASASALPEGFGFFVSRKGTFIAVSSSSNIWLINAATLPRLFTRSLEVRRKPLALDILDDGSLLAVLSKPTQVDLYKLNSQDEGKIEKPSTLMLEHDANTLAISPDGLILVTGHGYGIELFSLSPTAPEGCRRTAACPPMDCLQFSDDARTLLCTSYAHNNTGSTLFSVNGPYDGPFTEDGIPIQQDVDKAWTTQILFPEKVPRAHQATLRPDPGTGQVNELFAFDSNDRTWGIYDIAAQEFTNKDIFLPEQQSLQHQSRRYETIGETVPAVSLKGDYVAVGLGVQTTSLRLWKIEEDIHDQTCQCQGRDHACARSARYGYPNPAWTSCFSLRALQSDNSKYQEIKILRWVDVPDTPDVQRLIAVGNVTEASHNPVLSGLAQSSTGVVLVMDFDKTKNGKEVPLKTTYDLDNILPGERLPEEDIEFEREVELVRTRTVAQRRAADRAADGRRASRVGTTALRPQTSVARPTDRRSIIPDDETLAPEEAQALFEAPYDHSQPRSQTSLSRAATVAAASPANRRHLRALPFRPLEYRRADGLRELPHESDADNWVPPPPPYTPNIDLKTSLPFPQAAVGNSSRVPVRSASASLPSGTTAANHSLGNFPQGTSDEIPPVPPLPSVPSSGFTNILRPSPYPTGSASHSQSASDLTLPVPPTRPSLLHPLTYPSPAGGRRRSSTASPRGSISNHIYVPSDAGREQTTGQSAYQATSAVRSRNFVRQNPVVRPARPHTEHHSVGPFNNTLPATRSVSNLRPPVSFSNPFSNSSRRGSAPDIATHTRRRPVPGSDDHARSPLARPESRPEAIRHSMLPRISTRSGGPVNQLGPMSAPPTTHNRRHHHGISPRFGRHDDQEKEKSPSKRRLNCIVM